MPRYDTPIHRKRLQSSHLRLNDTRRAVMKRTVSPSSSVSVLAPRGRPWRIALGLAIVLTACGRTGLWIPPTREPIHPPPCSSAIRQVTISVRPDPGARLQARSGE
jgi:hypothetical protein